MSQIIYLYSRDKKSKIRVLILEIEGYEARSPNDDSLIYHYKIHRKSGLLNGKLTEQPTLIISRGKAGRITSQQVDLEVNSIINKQKDKGYVTFDDLFTPEQLSFKLAYGLGAEMNYQLIDSLLPKVKTYVNGQQKVMLAKDPKPDKKWFLNGVPTDKWNRSYRISKKLDGIRSSVVIIDGKFHAFSRTGKSLDVAFTKIFKELDLLRVAQTIGEDKMIDGELYVHGVPLQKIAGNVALKEWDEERQGKLEFWIFDYAGSDDNAELRAQKLNSIALRGTTVKINLQMSVNTYNEAKIFHDKWVQKGYEGAILRDCSYTYGYGARDERMIKLKEFTDDEFEIVGHKLGLRGSEDMCFICKTEDGKTFDPKPIGDRATKEKYIEDMPQLIGKMLTVKFFHYSPDGIPVLPSGVCIRDYD